MHTGGGTPPEILDALIIGAGFSGICLAIRLREAGIGDFLIYEEAETLGGTWHFNRYPGAACDVLSHFYSFSFAPNPDWSRKYSPWHEIRAYMEDCAARFGVREHMRFGKAVTQTVFDDASGLWEIRCADGGCIRARHVIDGTGGLHVPLIPHIEGAESFRGEQWHSSRWRDDVDLQDRRVAVIGSAASAVQIVPNIAGSVDKLTLFQRTANYLIPRDDRSYRRWEKWTFRHLPWIAKLYRTFLFLRYEWLAYPVVKTASKNLQRRYLNRLFRRNLAKCVHDPHLREQLTPDYPIGCKRILISDDFYPALNRENVSLVTDPIRRITPAGVETADGRLHEADVLIYATGFDTQGQHPAQRVVGPKGYRLADAWSAAPVAYEGCMVAGFPNYYLVTGPNTGVGSTSVIFMIEQAANFIMACILTAGRERLIAPTAEAMAAYDREIQTALAGTVWATSCQSWYKRDDGRITALYPWDGRTFRKRHEKLAAGDFEISQRSS